MKCRICGNRMIIMGKVKCERLKDWRPQAYVCDCGNVEYI